MTCEHFHRNLKLSSQVLKVKKTLAIDTKEERKITQQHIESYSHPHDISSQFRLINA